MRFQKLTYRGVLTLGILVSLLTMGARPLLFHTSAAKLPNRSLSLSDPTQGVTTDYKFSFEITTSTSVGSIRFQFCSDSPLIDYPCTAPTGFDASTASLDSQTGETSFTVGSGTDANTIFLTRIPSVTSPGTSNYVFSGIKNPINIGTHFARIQTYATTDGSGPSTDNGGLAFVTNDSIDLTTVVPPYLLYCGGLTISGFDCTTASGDYINFGELSSATTKTAESQMVVATNADNGYSLWADGTTMTAGNEIIPAVPGADVSRPGVSQFGLNLTANNSPGIGEAVSGPGTATVSPSYGTPDRFKFVPGDQLVSAPSVSDYRKFTVSYIININKDQPPGLYASTMTYVCLANF
jgi:hypothetical protein